MECLSNTKRRQSLRLKNFDYSNSGAYYITICTQGRDCMFGAIHKGKMELNEVGKMISKIWSEIPVYYPSFNLDEFVVMPNHFHAVIWKQEQAVGVDPCVYPCEAPVQAGQPQGVAPTINLSITDIVHRFKTLTTTRYIHSVKTQNWKPFNKRLWQRNYYERVIRNEDELNNIRQYILDNPKNWETEEYS